VTWNQTEVCFIRRCSDLESNRGMIYT